ncbi:MAG: PQQ-dependent sugar dehydrogenase [Chlorobi bacterium]|nr:MAG: protein up-regulated by thyroid hormone-putative PQQ-dependent glucose dehydrogenase [Chlorobi bacterium OLB7]MBK8910236.1 PQQ-dependent sugar dehydrogenase [Chlorobiota bacterium]MBX7217207.1 PQQ-dependent sugar dehydrogenase [Candidatus Kapabacteria bacterium]
MPHRILPLHAHCSDVMKILLIHSFSSLLIFFCASTAFAQRYEPIQALSDSLTFQAPVEITSARDGSNRLFVLEQQGIVRVFANTPTATSADTFIDIRKKIIVGSELGLLGIAFHPNYKNNGYFYLSYTAKNPLRSVIARYSVSSTNPNVADTASEEIILQVDQPYNNNKAGKIGFGPDGYLYISLGDGGKTGDPENRAQNLSLLLGKVLRIDVNNAANGKNYSIPPDNPLIGNKQGYAEEIWACGFRNPWRFSFDPQTNRLWLGDVGLYTWEEINIVEKGKNYGWNIMEGKHCASFSPNCDTAGLAQPIWEYPRDEGRTVIGGYVYRGSQLPELVGKYIFGDYTSGRVWALDYAEDSAPVTSLLFQKTLSLTAFGLDENNELLMLSYNGRIYRIRQLPSDAPGNSTDQGNFLLHSPKPNPATGRVIIPFLLSHDASVTISLFDPIGREVLQLFSGARSAGYHEIAFDASTIPPGTYFCRLSGGKQPQTRTLIIE